MIVSFRSRALKQFWEDGNLKGIDPKSAPRIKRLLDDLDVICDPWEMNVPGYHFHPLIGNRVGTYAVTIRANWRLTFEWDGSHVIRVDIEDYHGR